MISIPNMLQEVGSPYGDGTVSARIAVLARLIASGYSAAAAVGQVPGASFAFAFAFAFAFEYVTGDRCARYRSSEFTDRWHLPHHERAKQRLRYRASKKAHTLASIFFEAGLRQVRVCSGNHDTRSTTVSTHPLAEANWRGTAEDLKLGAGIGRRFSPIAFYRGAGSAGKESPDPP